MVREQIAGAQHHEQIRHLGAEALQARLRCWRPGLFFEVGPVELRERVHRGKVERTVHLIHVGRLQLQLARQQLEHLGRHAGIHLEAHDTGVTAAPPKLGLDCREQIFSVAVHVVEVAITRDTKRMVVDDLHAGEQRLHVQRDHVLERDVALAVGKRDETRQHRRHLHAREALLVALRIAHDHREVQREVGDVGEGVRRVHSQRREHGEDLLPEDGVELAELLLGHVFAAHEGDSCRGQRGHDVRVEDAGLALDETLDAKADGAQLLERGHAVR